MEYTNLMKTGNFDDFWFKNMMLACLGHLNIQWDWPRCPSPWHSRHLSCWVFNVWSRQVWDNQCLTAVLSGIPSVLHFQSPDTFCRWQCRFWQLCCQNLFHTAITNSETNVGSSSKKNIKKKQIQWTLWDHVIPSAFYSFHLISFTRISRGPSHYKSGSFNSKYELNTTQHPKA